MGQMGTKLADAVDWTQFQSSWDWLNNLFAKYFEQEPARVLMLGLDSAGKTTVLRKLKCENDLSTVPTIGFNVESVETGAGLQFTVWDVGGQHKMQSLWHHYYDNVDGMLFVVDSTDEQRLKEAGAAMNDILNDPQMSGVPVVVLANKQDMPNAVEPGRLVETLGLLQMTQRPWHVRGTCATSGAGLYEGLFELAEMIKNRRQPRSAN